ncbi:MAG: feruloyl-CoA synthase [Alphaproteobacteria bacterium]
MSKPPIVASPMPAPALDVERRDDGTLVLRSTEPLPDYPAQLGVWLRQWAAEAPDRAFLAERDADGGWRELTYAEARRQADAVAQALLDRGLGPDRPLMLLSGNSIDHAVMTYGAMQAGIPAVPVSPAYSLMSQDFAKVHHIVALAEPGMVYVEDGGPFAGVLNALAWDGVELVVGRNPPDGLNATLLADLLATVPGPAVEAAFDKVGPDSIAKYLFTSGSTGLPKGVINTQRMLTSNIAAVRATWPFLAAEPPVLVDWLPWNHTFGGNIVLNQVLGFGGTMYIDDGRPPPTMIERTARNLAEIAPTSYWNVPAGFGALIPFLERDEALAANFFSRCKMIFYAGAALPPDMWARLEDIAVKTLGHRTLMLSALGSTETAPLAVAVNWPIERPGNIGIPVAGTAAKLVPAGDKTEIRLAGPNITPGYLKRDDLTAAAFDEDGFYRIGDAVRLADPDDPAKGVVFDGRVAEDFKLTTGTWVSAGSLRVAVLAAATPLLQDAVVAGHDRDAVCLLAWPNVAAARSIAGAGDDAPVEDVLRDPKVVAHLRDGLGKHNEANPGSSTRIARVILMAEPPNVDGNEITDKGYVNQRATLTRRAALVKALYAEPPDQKVIVV